MWRAVKAEGTMRMTKSSRGTVEALTGRPGRYIWVRMWGALNGTLRRLDLEVNDPGSQ